jgi:hypothetical protein
MRPDLRYRPPDHDLIRRHSAESNNDRIDRETRDSLDEVADSSELVRKRLGELDREWHVDRALMLNFAVIGGLSGGMTMRSLLRTGRFGGWGTFFWIQVAFLAHHAIRGWCPPLPVFRRLGFRSAREICAERCVLENRLAELEG